MGHSQFQQGSARGLDWLVRGQLGDRRLVEGTGFQHGALCVAFGQFAEQLVEQRRVDHYHREQVQRERERVGAEAEAVRADAAVAQRVRHRPGERPPVVVDGGALAAVVLVHAQQFLGELA